MHVLATLGNVICMVRLAVLGHTHTQSGKLCLVPELIACRNSNNNSSHEPGGSIISSFRISSIGIGNFIQLLWIVLAISCRKRCHFKVQVLSPKNNTNENPKKKR